MKKTKITIVMPVWRRAEILKIVLKQLSKFIDFNKDLFEFRTVFVLSNEDPEHFELFRNIMYFKKYDLTIVNYSNDFVSDKTNAGFHEAMKEDFDYIMNIGSDDLIHEFLLTLYKPYFKIKKPFFGINSLYITDFESKKTVFYKSYNSPFAVGAGRMISREVMNKVYAKYSKLYPEGLQRVLDANSAKRIHKLNYGCAVLDSGQFPYIVDLKSDININDFEKFDKYKGSTDIEKNIVLNTYEL